jgi:DNA-binding XRE family transcriptional regulator
MEWTAARIRRFREVGLCLPQDEFATALGFAKRTIGNAERGAHPPSLALRRALDDALEKASEAQRDRFLAALPTQHDAVPAIQRTDPTLESVELLRRAEASDLAPALWRSLRSSSNNSARSTSPSPQLNSARRCWPGGDTSLTCSTANSPCVSAATSTQ